MPRVAKPKPAKTPVEPRRRDAAATRQAILNSARKAFAAHGYDGAGLREIAANAGVTAMLVNRYFGSKEGLFEAAIDDAMSDASVIRKGMPDLDSLGAYLAAGVLETTRPDVTPLDGSLMMVRSGSTTNPRVIEIGRKQIEKMHLKTLAAALGGDNAAERAALILSLIAGVQVMRQMIHLTPLAKTSPATLQKLLAPVIQQLADGA
ncbi:MAG: TetR family transcriptional regulator [Hyphomonadaceae bacterium]